MSKNIFAYTELPSVGYKYYPAYISINQESSGKISVTVRAPEQKDGLCGSTSRIELDDAEFERLKQSL